MATNLAQLRASQTAANTESPLTPLLAGAYIPQQFDPDAYHAMQERDTALIRDELLHGTASDAFVYSFSIKGKTVTGISVVGARELAAQYKGIKSRIVATVEKRGALFIFRTFTPLNIETRTLFDLSEEPDFYECVMEVSDLKSGNSIEVRKKELKTETTRDGGSYDRPHYDVIAESKAFRNGVLSVLPQSVIREFRERCLKAKSGVSDEKTLPQLRDACMAHATKNGVTLDRNVLMSLTFAELNGIGGAAKQGIDAFKRAAAALSLIPGVDPTTGELPPPPPPAPEQPAADKSAKPQATPASDQQVPPTTAKPPAAANDADADTGPSWGDDTSGADIPPQPAPRPASRRAAPARTTSAE